MMYRGRWRDHVARAWSAGYYYTRRGLVQPIATRGAPSVVLRGLVLHAPLAWSDAAFYYTRRL